MLHRKVDDSDASIHLYLSQKNIDKIGKKLKVESYVNKELEKIQKKFVTKEELLSMVKKFLEMNDDYNTNPVTIEEDKTDVPVPTVEVPAEEQNVQVEVKVDEPVNPVPLAEVKVDVPIAPTEDKVEVPVEPVEPAEVKVDVPVDPVPPVEVKVDVPVPPAEVKEDVPNPPVEVKVEAPVEVKVEAPIQVEAKVETPSTPAEACVVEKVQIDAPVSSTVLQRSKSSEFKSVVDGKCDVEMSQAISPNQDTVNTLMIRGIRVIPPVETSNHTGNITATLTNVQSQSPMLHGITITNSENQRLPKLKLPKKPSPPSKRSHSKSNSTSTEVVIEPVCVNPNGEEQLLDENIMKIQSMDKNALSHLLLKLMGEKAVNWGNDCAADLIVKSQDEYVLLQKYRNSNPMHEKLLKDLSGKKKKGLFNFLHKK